ncbi:MAG TPA: N-formylglutamate deformylase [Rubrivivax sp.]|nr:N-formylglutamate deformylase [Rubrivivax sp.]
MNDAIYTLQRGTTPLLLSLPHAGTHIPPALAEALLPRALQTEDTDWHLERLYAFATELGASLIVPRHSRYVVDLNRPRDNQPMYAGANNTELCPTRFFTGDALYRDGLAPSEAEVQQRVATYWQPYHDALRTELERLRAAHGHALLWDGHSIKSELPWLFDGRLPDLNLGTAGGASCAPSLRQALSGVLRAQSDYSVAIDGRFKGGHITRHYGRPRDSIHAVQLEQCWSSYMRETPPYTWDAEHAARVQPLLRRLLQTMLDWKPPQ